MRNRGYFFGIFLFIFLLLLSTLPLFASDMTAPVVEFVYLNGKSIYSGDIIQNSPILSVRMTDQQSGDLGIVSYNVVVENQDDVALSFPVNTEIFSTPVPVVDTSFRIAPLKVGQYKVRVVVSDAQGFTTFFSSPVFLIKDDFELTGALAGPNPFDPSAGGCHIQYSLSLNADVSIYIYSLNGTLVFNQQISAGSVGGNMGFNSVQWDGKNRFGDYVANGVYIAYIIAQENGLRRLGKVKIEVFQ